MENYAIFASTIINSENQTLYTNSSGFIIRTMIINNTNQTDSTLTLTLDNTSFKIPLSSGETRILDSPIFSKSLKGSGSGVSIHVSGIQI